jgi:nucleotide-binding universal stress UspA family protein
MDKRQIVLVAIDDATDMERTMASALGIARARGADVHAIRVEPRRAPHDPRDGWHVAADLRPRSMPAAAASDGVRVHAVTLRGVPEHVIPAYAQLYAAGVLVVERDYGSSRFWRNGRVVERMARQSAIPLLVLPRRRATGRDESAPRRILVPVDFSVASAVALRNAVEVARRHGARLTLFHALGDVTRHMTFSAGAAWEVIRELGAHEKAASERLHRKASFFGASDVDTEVATGRAGGGIVETARRVEPDLIVMGAARRSWFDRVVAGSTLPGVLRRATVPVLVVPAVAGARPWPDGHPVRQLDSVLGTNSAVAGAAA